MSLEVFACNLFCIQKDWNLRMLELHAHQLPAPRVSDRKDYKLLVVMYGQVHVYLANLQGPASLPSMLLKEGMNE